MSEGGRRWESEAVDEVPRSRRGPVSWIEGYLGYLREKSPRWVRANHPSRSAAYQARRRAVRLAGLEPDGDRFEFTTKGSVLWGRYRAEG